jgi:hypothetical protein
MRTESIKTSLVIIGAIIFNVIFWREKLGINTVLFDVFIIASVFYLYPSATKNNTCRWLALGHLVTAVMVVVHNTMLSKIGFSITLLLFVSFTQYIHRSVWYAGGSVILNYILAIPNLFRQLKSINGSHLKLSGISGPVRMLLIPVFLLTVFFVIYAFANTVFLNIASDIATAVQHWFANIFDWFSIPRFCFFLLGIIITAGLILRAKNNWFSAADIRQKDDLLRKKHNLKKWRKSSFADLLSVIIGKASIGMLAIKNEFRIGLISLVLLNILLLFINFLDIKYVWLGYTFSEDVSLSAYVHEGAGFLILSIILAMLVLLFFFRGNLNFYKRNKWLRYGAYLWIFQNLFLVISVFIRDYYYISHYGLAYKRIGLLFFLAMVISGLLLVFIKINFTRTTYYLLRLNAWVAIVLLICASTVDWDVTIAKYNLARKTTIPIDVPFILSLSDRTLPIIEKNKDILINTNVFNSNNCNYRIDAVSFFESRKKEFLNGQKSYTWLSWNVADAETRKALKQPVKSTSINTIYNSKILHHETDPDQSEMEFSARSSACFSYCLFYYYFTM